MFITAVCLIFLLKLKWPKNKSELWVVRQFNLEIFCFNEYGDNDETMILYQWNELQLGHSNHEHLVTIECQPRSQGLSTYRPLWQAKRP